MLPAEVWGIITMIPADTLAAMMRVGAVAAILAEAVEVIREEAEEMAGAGEVAIRAISGMRTGQCEPYGFMVMSTTLTFPSLTSVWTSNLAEPRLKFPPAT